MRLSRIMPRLIAAWPALMLGVACGQTATAIPESCIRAAKTILGAKAEVLHYGSIGTKGDAEAFAAVKLESTRTPKGCVPITEMVIIRQDKGDWRTIFEARRHMQIKNPEGFVGIEYIDDSFDYPGFCLNVNKGKPSDPFSFALTFLKSGGATEGLPMYIGWNSAVGRYQSMTYEDPAAFEPEVKNPRHISVGKRGK